MNGLGFKCIFISLIFIKYYIRHNKNINGQSWTKKTKKVKVNTYYKMEGVIYQLLGRLWL